ncbi:hypothetical protein ACFPRL_19230 [Pseudoclavibacter helvolus]
MACASPREVTRMRIAVRERVLMRVSPRVRRTPGARPRSHSAKTCGLRSSGGGCACQRPRSAAAERDDAETCGFRSPGSGCGRPGPTSAAAAGSSPAATCGFRSSNGRCACRRPRSVAEARRDVGQTHAQRQAEVLTGQVCG